MIFSCKGPQRSVLTNLSVGAAGPADYRDLMIAQLGREW